MGESCGKFQPVAQQTANSAVRGKQLVTLTHLDRQIAGGGEAHQFLPVRVGQFLRDHQLGGTARKNGFAAWVDPDHAEPTPPDLFVEPLDGTARFAALSLDEGADGLIEHGRGVMAVGRVKHRAGDAGFEVFGQGVAQAGHMPRVTSEDQMVESAFGHQIGDQCNLVALKAAVILTLAVVIMLTAPFAAKAFLHVGTGRQNLFADTAEGDLEDASTVLGADCHHKPVKAVLELNERKNRGQRRCRKVRLERRAKRYDHQQRMLAGSRKGSDAADVIGPGLAQHLFDVGASSIEARARFARKGDPGAGGPGGECRPQHLNGLAKVKVNAEHWSFRFRQGGQGRNVAAQVVHLVGRRAELIGYSHSPNHSEMGGNARRNPRQEKSATDPFRPHILPDIMLLSADAATLERKRLTPGLTTPLLADNTSAMTELPQDAWFYSREGERLGPVTLAELRAKALQDELNPRLDLVWTQGMTGWKPAGEIDALFERRTSEAPPATNPYTSPEAESTEGMIERQGEWPGVRRRGYLAATLLLPMAWSATLGLVPVIFGQALEPALLEKITLGGALGLCLIALYCGLQRFLNLGMSRWWYLGNFVPLLNLWVGYRCFACPAGYAYHKKMDGIGIALAIAYWLLIVTLILALIALIAVLFTYADDPRVTDLLRQVSEAVRARSVSSTP